MRVWQEDNRLVIGDGRYTLWLEPWGNNSFRVRMTGEAVMDGNDWALTEKVPECVPEISFEEVDTTDPWYKGDEYRKYHQTGRIYTIRNGKITAKI